MDTKSAHSLLSDKRYDTSRYANHSLPNALNWQSRNQQLIDRHPLRTLAKPLLLVLPAAGFAALVVWGALQQPFDLPSVVVLVIAGIFVLAALGNLAFTISEIRGAKSQVAKASARVAAVRATIATLDAEADVLQAEVDRIDALAAERPEDNAAKDQLFDWFQAQYPETPFDMAVEFLAADLEAAGRRA